MGVLLVRRRRERGRWVVGRKGEDVGRRKRRGGGVGGRGWQVECVGPN